MLCPETHKFRTEFKRKSFSNKRKFDGVKKEPKSKHQKTSKDSDDFKKSTLHKVVKLENPSGHNLCWLNSLMYMLISVDLVSVLAEYLVSLQGIDQFFSLAERFLLMINSGVYVQKHQTNFAEAAMEKLRDDKPIGQKKQYIIGEPQDVCEMTESIIFPLFLQASIEFVTTIHLHQTDSESHLETKLSFLCEVGGPTDFVFASPIRNIEYKKNGTYVDSTDFASIKEVLIAKSPIPSMLSTPEKYETRCEYRLVSFISYLGHTEQGHYITYVNDLDSNVCAVFDGPSLSCRTRTQFVEAARKTSQLLLYKLVSQKTVSAPKPPAEKKEGKKWATKPDSPFVDLSDAPDNSSSNSRVWVKFDPLTHRQEMYTPESDILKSVKAEINGLIIHSFSAMLVVVYEKSEKLLISNRNPLIRKNGVMLPLRGPFFQVVNINNNHWVLFTNIRQSNPNDVYVFDSLYSRGKDLATEYVDHSDYDLTLISVIKQLKPQAEAMKIVDIEQQRDVVNCGIYSLFHAWCLIKGKILNTIDINVNHVRSQLWASFVENEVLDLAPTKSMAINLSTVLLLKDVCLADD